LLLLVVALTIVGPLFLVGPIVCGNFLYAKKRLLQQPAELGDVFRLTAHDGGACGEVGQQFKKKLVRSLGKTVGLDVLTLVETVEKPDHILLDRLKTPVPVFRMVRPHFFPIDTRPKAGKRASPILIRLGHSDGLLAREHPHKPAPFPEDEAGKTGDEHAYTADTQENFFLVQIDPLKMKPL